MYVRRAYGALNDGAIRFLADIERLGKNLNETQLDGDFRISTLLLYNQWKLVSAEGWRRTSTTSVTSALTVTVKSSPGFGGSGDTTIDSICIGSVGRP